MKETPPDFPHSPAIPMKDRHSPNAIRLADAGDVEAMLAIYAPVVENTAISFELVPPSADEFGARLANALARYPWLVCEIGGEVAGYAYAGEFKTRAAYQWSVETTVYVRADRRRLGVGRAVYASLFACLRIQGFRAAYAGIALPNAASVALHESMGFERVGVYPKVGYKLGAWRDVGWWRLALADAPDDPPPAPPIPLPDLADGARFAQALRAGLGDLR